MKKFWLIPILIVISASLVRGQPAVKPQGTVGPIQQDGAGYQLVHDPYSGGLLLPVLPGVALTTHQIKRTDPIYVAGYQNFHLLFATAQADSSDTLAFLVYPVSKETNNSGDGFDAYILTKSLPLGGGVPVDSTTYANGLVTGYFIGNAKGAGSYWKGSIKLGTVYYGMEMPTILNWNWLTSALLRPFVVDIALPGNLSANYLGFIIINLVASSKYASADLVATKAGR